LFFDQHAQLQTPAAIPAQRFIKAAQLLRRRLLAARESCGGPA
jgi:hypothetical protein